MVANALEGQRNKERNAAFDAKVAAFDGNSIEELETMIAGIRHLKSQLVGNLYPGILGDEVLITEEAIKRKRLYTSMTCKQALRLTSTDWVYRFVGFDLTVFVHRDGTAVQTDLGQLVPATRLYREGWKPLPATHSLLNDLRHHYWRPDDAIEKVRDPEVSAPREQAPQAVVRGLRAGRSL